MLLPKQAKATVRVSIPFELAQDVGLGDVIRRLTSKVGISPCAPCEQRAAALNRYVTFTGRSESQR